MLSHISHRVRHGFTSNEILLGVVLLCILLATLSPQPPDPAVPCQRANLQSQLQTIRSQIELYNVQNPQDAYDENEVLPDFWVKLVEFNYLQRSPKNPLQGGSTSVADAPGAGVGWIWATTPTGGDWSLNLYAVDENDGWFDGDGDGEPD